MLDQFNESKSFRLTKEETKVLEWVVNNIVSQYERYKKVMKHVVKSSYLEELMRQMPVSDEAHKWFFGRALLASFEHISSVPFTENQTFTKLLPDSRTTIRFKEDKLKESLYDIGRFYFMRTFNHRYDSLRSTGQSWRNLDDYVIGRENEIKMQQMVDELPELKGIF